jgi:DNA-3-methyladenine glycosylase I
MLESFVAIGDSFTEGLDDPKPDGTFRGWADLVAARLVLEHPGLRYANLAVRGRKLAGVMEEQLPRVEEMRPSLVTFAAGGNDLIRMNGDVPALAHSVHVILERLLATGATTVVFAGFDPRAVAEFDSSDVDRMMDDAGIVRNRKKIEATIGNARAVVNLLDEAGEGAFGALFWSYGSGSPAQRPVSMSDLAAATEGSRAMSAHLKGIGLRWVGPTTMYAAMQACGVVNDHLIGCAAGGK